MKILLLQFVLFFSLDCLVAQQHQPPREAQQQVDLGQQASRNAHYEEAIQHFQRALAIDNNFCWARLLLGSTFAAKYVPQRKSAYNRAKAKQALEHYQAAMKCDPALSEGALHGMAYLNVVMGQPAKARDFYRQLLKIQPNSRDPYYAIASCDLEEASANTERVKARLNVNPGESLADTPACPALRKENLPLVEDGLQMLSKAMQLHTADEGGDQVTASVLYRMRAEIECGDLEARKADEKNAADWNDLAVKIGKQQRDAIKKKDAAQK
jgi:tetratricopeptide (TPR) repeat protein